MKFGKDMKIGPKLFAGFAVVLLLTTALGVVAVLQIGNMHDQSNVMEKAAELETSIKDIRQQEKNYVIRGDQSYVDKVNKDLEEVKSLAAELESTVTLAENKAALKEGLTALPKYESAFEELQTLTKTKEEQLTTLEKHAQDIENAIKGSSTGQATRDALMMQLLAIRRAEKNFVAREDEKYVTQVSEGINSLKADTGATTAIKTTLDTYQKDFNAYVSTVHDFDELCAVGGPLVQSARKVNEAADTVFVNAREAAAAAASAATMFVIVFILVAVGVGVGVALTITRSITGPVTEVVRVMKDFAAGKLDSKATTKASGELQEMIHTLNKFGDGLQTIIKDVGNVTGDMAAGNLNTEFSAETPGDFDAIRDNLNQATVSLSDLIGELKGAINNVAEVGKESATSVEQMNSGMQQISSASQEIARGAQETSGTVNESAKEIKDTNAMLQQVQSNAEESNKFAMESAENAKEMSAVAKKSGEGMIEIQEALGNTVEVIKALGNSIEQIGTTTEMIESIADQTNLLALNAAIEAARAGEHGRGFAVVAEEVRKLAENSKQSTAEIGSMITSLHEEMEKVTKATDTVTERAGVGREDLEKVVASVEKTAGLINKIKDSMTEVTEGARQGAESIEKVSKGVDEIASSAEESASSSEESSSAVEEQTAAVEQLSSGMEKLAEISDQAAEMIGKFKLKETRE